MVWTCKEKTYIFCSKESRSDRNFVVKRVGHIEDSRIPIEEIYYERLEN